MSTKNTDPPQTSDGSQQTMVNLRYHKTERKTKPKNPKKKDAASATNG
jgi:hypothetical protein